MKKVLIWALCAVLALGMTACGGTAPAEDLNLETMVPVNTEAPAAVPEDASAAEAAPGDEEPAEEEALPASAADAAVDEEALTAAEACVGQPVEALYEAVGEPDEAQYAASCLEENAEDGMLFYDGLGFYVWTVKTAAEETVHEVYVLD